MKVLVTGANGLLGQKLLKLLSSNSEVQVAASGRGPNRNPHQRGYTYIEADLTNHQQVDDLVQHVCPEAIIHCAAMTQVDECERNQRACREANVLATKYLLEATSPFNPFFLFVSTDFIFDGTKARLDETESPGPVSYYGETKLAGERLVQKSGLPWAIVRTVLVYGVAFDASRSNIVLWVKEKLGEGEPIQVVNDQYRTPTLAEDLAEGCWLVAKGRSEGIFHISGNELLTPYEMALRTADHFGLDKELITPVDASTFSQPGQRPLKTGFCIDKARQTLGYQPRSFSEGLLLVDHQLSSS